MPPGTADSAALHQPARAHLTGRSGGSPTDQSESFWKRHRRAIVTAVSFLFAIGFFYVVVPRLVGLGPTLKLLRTGDLWWLALAVVLEALSYAGAIVLFRGVFTGPEDNIGWKASSQITLAGTAATKVVASAGAGGIALTVWALRGYGLSGDSVATRMVCYEILNYGVYMAAMAIAGFGLWLGVFPGPAPVGLTLIPAVFAVIVILLVLSMLFVYEPVERFLKRRAKSASGRAASRWERVATLPRAVHAGLLAAIGMVKRRDSAVLGALAGWGFDIAVLWASFRAFGHSPPGAVLVMGYYVAQLANVLPIPGGIGGVEGGMIGAFLLFGVQRYVAVLAVLAYRTISYWLPTLPGAIAYWRLLRRFKRQRRQITQTA